MTSCGNGGGTEEGSVCEGGATAGETKGSPSAISLSSFAANGRSVVGSPGGRFSICNSASRLRNLVSKSLTERSAPVAFAIATKGSTKQTAMTISRIKTRASIKIKMCEPVRIMHALAQLRESINFPVSIELFDYEYSSPRALLLRCEAWRHCCGRAQH